MTAQESSRLGVCPVCDEDILARHVLIRYETDSDDREVWTECPGCGGVVHPR
ncbi:hypothetical protein ACFQMA_16975 [Halosimplex aquaticum]|uniref:DUF7837 domain-containing protein n=1 Tax=Halosimplex aquaticum TaxID=3026162 RepID=A0ABD5Y240_9EURY|nr:hypothetical protein [Halosimplex aquaticum]